MSEDGTEQIDDRSGSCAIVTLIIDEMCYVANVGDSRAILSGESGSRIFPLSRDHKPTDPHEQQRIFKAGGQVYSRNHPLSTKSSIAYGV